MRISPADTIDAVDVIASRLRHLHYLRQGVLSATLTILLILKILQSCLGKIIGTDPRLPAYATDAEVWTPPPRVDAFAPAHLALQGSLRESPERPPKPPGSREICSGCLKLNAYKLKTFFPHPKRLLLYCKYERKCTLTRFSYSPSAAVSSARETDHGLPGLAVKNETDASSLVEVCFLIATCVQRMRPRAQL